jgi:hypothetical protein
LATVTRTYSQSAPATHRTLSIRSCPPPRTDPEVTHRTGRAVNAIRIQRKLLGIARFRAGPPVGACREPRTGRRYAAVSVGGKKRHLGSFDTQEEAQRAYQEAVQRFR